MLGGGTLVTAIGVGVGIAESTETLVSLFSEEEPEVSAAAPLLILVGLTAMAGSIPLFISAGKNKKKAAASLSFKMENATQLNRLAFVQSQYPAVSFKFRL